LTLGNIGVSRDWGYAPDYVNAMKLIAQNLHSADFVVATGQLHSLSEMCSIAFEALGLRNYLNYIESNSSLYRSNENSGLVGDSSKLFQTIRWSPEVTFEEMIKMMVFAESN
jgi:GDPmannose 4,6-dehydratase